MSYCTLKKFLNENYQRIHGSVKDYYLDQNGRIVATIETKEDGIKLITTYIDDVRGELNAHYNKIVLSISNKINQPMVDILLGSNNDTTISNGKICFYDNSELDKMAEQYNKDRFPQYNLGAIGIIKLSSDKVKLYLGENKRIEGIKTIQSKNNGPIHLCTTNEMKVITKKLSNNKN